MISGPDRHPHDVLVIGAGGAGLRAAIEAAASGASVGLVCKSLLGKAHTVMAEGGIAAALRHVDDRDSWQTHFRDTMVGGKMLNNARMAQLHALESPARVRELEQWGAVFDRTRDGRILQRPFGGHSHPRLAHVGDRTGLEMIRTLQDRAVSMGMAVYMEHTITHLTTNPSGVTGAFGYRRVDGAAVAFPAKAVLLATGGIGKAYEITSNSWEYSGDGQALAVRAGAELIDMEFVQFHPTGMVWPPGVEGLLVTEAVRGEGAKLIDKNGYRFMADYHPQLELAPRDVVSRAIDAEMKRTGDDFVVLDMTHLKGDFLAERFPNIHKRCMELGIDMRSQPIPVVPAAHYSCGGVVVDARGRSTVRNLYAIGEVSMTGLHGACRLASNSLLEAMVFAARAADDVRHAEVARPAHVAPWYAGEAGSSDEAVVVSHNWDEIRRLMWNYVGIVRSDRRLERAARRIELIRDEIRDYYWNVAINGDLVELRNIALCAQLIIECARRRTESRGLHYNIDHPDHDPRLARDTIVVRGDGPVV